MVRLSDATAPRLRLLMPHTALSSFIQADVASLEMAHEVTLVPCGSLAAIARSVLLAPRGDAVVCWFGSTRYLPLALSARLWGRPVIIISGGNDVASVPALDYGNMYHRGSRLLGRALFRLATVVASISKSAAAEASANAGVRDTQIRLLYLGLDGSLGAGAPSWAAKERMALTVGHADLSSIHRKGILTFVRASRLLPEVPMMVAGPITPDALTVLRAAAGPNVRFEGKVSWDRLCALYAGARTYVQPSRHEAFGYSVAEAMLHGCVPVVSRCYSLPEVVGDSGWYIEDPDDLGQVVAAIHLGLEAPTPGQAPRDRVLAMFSGAGRREALLKLVVEVCQRGVCGTRD